MRGSEAFESLLSSLNPDQKEAVLGGDGPVLVLAGAGSGKTRVLTNRIAYLLQKGLATPNSILAVTFTNKAAREMSERLERVLGYPLTGAWIGTFHSIGARVLRREGMHIGLSRNFNIYDEEDRLRCLTLVFDELNISREKIPAKLAAHRISNAKNAFLVAGEYSKTIQQDNENERLLAEVYRHYEHMLRTNNAVDFDDLLMLPVLLFQKKPEILAAYQNRFTHLLVDEYQDTNRAQNLFLQYLAARHKNLFVVGDDDQSIYRWRGADLRNILDFPEAYPGCKVFRLEQNYRSTKNILALAHSVIVNNRGRHEKKLWTEKPEGAKVQLLEASSDKGEAELIVKKINEEFEFARRQCRDFAILYRTNAQSRAIEEALRRHGIPYTIVGGIRFYERKEIKDVLAYLRSVANPSDTVSLLRVINYPLRGIGEATIARLRQASFESGRTFFETLALADQVAGLSPRQAKAVQGFHLFISKYINLKSQISLTELANSLIEETEIIQNFKQEGTPDALSRIDNIRELLNAVHEYAQANEGARLEGFLEEVSLVSDIDSWEDRSNAVTLMTLHSAKGLEFPVVFLAGLEEGLFPLSRSLENRDDLEEERRLFYVGATRAKEVLYLSYANARRKYGSFSPSTPSRFLREIDASLVQRHRQVNPAELLEQTRLPSGRSHRKRYSDAEQVMPDYENYSQENHAIDRGVVVRHPKFGVGTVVRVEGRGANMKVDVEFDDWGRKTLMVYYAKLEIL